MIGRDVAVNKWCFDLWKWAMKGYHDPMANSQMTGVRSLFRLASFTFVLTKNWNKIYLFYTETIGL